MAEMKMRYVDFLRNAYPSLVIDYQNALRGREIMEEHSGQNNGMMPWPSLDGFRKGAITSLESCMGNAHVNAGKVNGHYAAWAKEDGFCYTLYITTGELKVTHRLLFKSETVFKERLSTLFSCEFLEAIQPAK